MRERHCTLQTQRIPARLARRNPHPPTLPQTLAAAASPATRGGGAAIRLIAWGRPPPQRHPPPPPDAEAARMATGKDGGRRGGRRGGPPPPAARSEETVKGTAARPPARPPARGTRPTRRSGPYGRHQLLITATRWRHPPPRRSLVSLLPTKPRHAVAAAGSHACGDSHTRDTPAACNLRGNAAAQRGHPPPAGSPAARGGRATPTPTAARAATAAWANQHRPDARLCRGRSADSWLSRRCAGR